MSAGSGCPDWCDGSCSWEYERDGHATRQHVTFEGYAAITRTDLRFPRGGSVRGFPGLEVLNPHGLNAADVHKLIGELQAMLPRLEAAEAADHALTGRALSA